MIKDYEDHDYEMIKSWWENHPAKVFVLPKEILPKTGYICYNKGKAVLATWLYISTCGTIAWQAWTVASLDSDKKTRTICFTELMDHVDEKMKKLGLKVIFAGPNNASLLDRFIRNGYTSYETDVVHCMKLL